jgi:hypothetical protein
MLDMRERGRFDPWSRLYDGVCCCSSIVIPIDYEPESGALSAKEREREREREREIKKISSV